MCVLGLGPEAQGLVSGILIGKWFYCPKGPWCWLQAIAPLQYWCVDIFSKLCLTELNRTGTPVLVLMSLLLANAATIFILRPR